MSLRGKGMLVVFTDVKSRYERDFNEWYNREHMDERISVPGIHRARRYVTVRGSPKYLAIYECSRVGDLATPQYLDVLANPTPWTKAVTARLAYINRMTLRMQVDQTHGIGGALATIKFTPGSGHRNNLIGWLRDTTLPRIVKQPGMVGAAAGENDFEVANAPLRAKSMDNPKADEAEWVVLLEGSDAATVGAAARQSFKLAALRPFGVREAPVIASYRLLFGAPG